ncbi:kappa-type opioid receptor-like [Oculina patagonica]
MENSTTTMKSNSTGMVFPLLWFNATDSNNFSSEGDCVELGMTDKVAGGVVYSIVSLFGTLGNILVILVIWRTTNLRTIYGLLVSNLAIADFLMTAFVNLPFFHAYAERSSCENPISLGVSLVIAHISVASSLLTLTFLSIDRCFAICSPLKHRAVMTITKLKVVLLIIWVESLLLPILQALYPKSLVLWYLPSCSVIFCFIIISVCSVLTILNVRRSSSRIHDLHQNQDGGRISAEMLQRNKQVAKTTALIIILFVFSWTPFAVIRLSKRSLAYYSLGFWFATLGYANSTVNPCIYFYRHRNYRQALKAIIYSQ